MKRDTPHHWKMNHLMTRLGISRHTAVGLMEMLFHFAAKFPGIRQGNIGKLPNTVIANSLEWPEDPDELVQAMVEAQWFDEHPTHRLVIHDWSEHCDDSVDRWLMRQGIMYADGRGPRRNRPKNGGEQKSGAPIPASGAPKSANGEPGRACLSLSLSPSLSPLTRSDSEIPSDELIMLKFEEYWALLPKGTKVGRAGALKVFKQNGCYNHMEKILAAVKHQKASVKWITGYAPKPATWLSEERWNDDAEAYPAPGDKAATGESAEESARRDQYIPLEARDDE